MYLIFCKLAGCFPKWFYAPSRGTSESTWPFAPPALDTAARSSVRLPPRCFLTAVMKFWKSFMCIFASCALFDAIEASLKIFAGICVGLLVSLPLVLRYLYIWNKKKPFVRYLFCKYFLSACHMIFNNVFWRVKVHSFYYFICNLCSSMSSLGKFHQKKFINLFFYVFSINTLNELYTIDIYRWCHLTAASYIFPKLKYSQITFSVIKSIT